MGVPAGGYLNNMETTITEQNNSERKKEGEISALIRLGIPVLVAQLGVIVVSFADNIMVGQYGVDELAAAAFVNSLFLIPIVMQIGFAAGLTPLIGALFGKGDRFSAGQTLRAGLQTNLILSGVLTAIMAVLYFFLDRFGQPEELLPLIREYYLIILWTLIPMAAFNTYMQTANGINNTSLPMWTILIANIVNILGNWLLIFGVAGMPELGLNGAGISTLTARIVSILAIAIIFHKRKDYLEYTDGFHSRSGNRKALRRQVWTTSYPVMIQSGMECSLWSLGAVTSGWFGKIQLAAYQVVTTIGQLGFMTFISFGTATSIRVANYTGLENWHGVRRTARAGLILNAVLATIASLIFIVAGKIIIRCFTPEEAVVVSAFGLILPLVIYQYLDAVQLTYCNAIRGTSEVKPLLWISILSYLVTGAPVMMLFAKVFDWGNIGVYYSFDVALAVAAIVATVIFFRILRKKSKLFL